MSQYRNIVYLADRSGCGKWRKIWPIQHLDCIASSTNVQVDYTQTPILDPNYYKGVNTVTLQRWISDDQANLLYSRIKPCCDENGTWISYEIDDLMYAPEIPMFNRGRKAYESEHRQQIIKSILEGSDFITVTTDYIKQCYNKYYGIPLEKIIALPNFLPRYLYGDRYRPGLKVEQFKRLKNKPRIGVVSSLSHYNIDDVRKTPEGLACRKTEVKNPDGTTSNKWLDENEKEIPEESTIKIYDDLDIIIDTIRETVNDFQWVFFGFEPPALHDLVVKKKIEVHGGTTIMRYPSYFDNLALQAVVAPIQDIEFNRCKSFIKYMECASNGVPLFASNSLPYSRVMPQHQLFYDGKDLKEKLMKFKFSSVGVYEKMIDNQWRWLNSPCHEGDFDIKNFWMEDNTDIFLDMCKMNTKSGLSSMKLYLDIRNKRNAEKLKNTIFSNENGVEILK